MKTGKKIVFAIIGIVLLALFYYFPLQRAMAEIKFWSYAKEAGIQKTDISERKNERFLRIMCRTDITWKPFMRVILSTHIIIIII